MFFSYLSTSLRTLFLNRQFCTTLVHSPHNSGALSPTTLVRSPSHILRNLLNSSFSSHGSFTHPILQSWELHPSNSPVMGASPNQFSSHGSFTQPILVVIARHFRSSTRIQIIQKHFYSFHVSMQFLCRHRLLSLCTFRKQGLLEPHHFV